MKPTYFVVLVLVLGLSACSSTGLKNDSKSGIHRNNTDSNSTKSNQVLSRRVLSEKKPGASKRVKANCHPKVEMQKLHHLIGKNVIVQTLWYDVSPNVKALRLPYKALGQTTEGLMISPHEFPMRDQYMALLFGTGHLLFREGQTILDVCSANISLEDEDNPYH